MKKLFLTLLIVPVLLGANPAFALELCAKIDKDTGDPVEVSIGTTEQLADIATNTTDISTNTAALAGKAELPCATQVGTDVFFEGWNVHVRSGSGATWGTGTQYAGTVNGLGNLIVGPYHSYPSYGGFIAGKSNTASGVYSSVSAGFGSEASGEGSSVSGGQNNHASSSYSVAP